MLATALLAVLAPAQVTPWGNVLEAKKISATAGGFAGVLNDGDGFGSSVAVMGDLDGDGVTDLAVGAPGDDEGGADRGAVWILFLNADGSVKTFQKLSDGQGGLTGGLRDGDAFGTALDRISDLDGNGVDDLLVGAPASSNGTNFGRVYVLFLQADGTIQSHTTLSEGEGGFGLTLQPSDPFGHAIASIGDLDADGTEDIAIGRSATGYIYVVRLKPDGTAKTNWRIGTNEGGLQASVGASFGSSFDGLGDFDGDGVLDLLVGDDELLNSGVPGDGSYWILNLTSIGTVAGEIHVRAGTHSGFTSICGTCAFGRQYEVRRSAVGSGVTALGDLDGDGRVELALGALNENNFSCNCGPDPEAVPQAGAAWLMRLDSDGKPAAIGSLAGRKINVDEGGLAPGTLETLDNFGADVDALGDFDGDGALDLLVGAPGDDDGGSERGAVYVLQLNSLLSSQAVVRNGQGINPLCYQTNSLPFQGSLWCATVDSTNRPGTTLTGIFGHLQPLTPGLVRSFGELLIDLGSPRLFSRFAAPSFGSTIFCFTIPTDPSLFGFESSTQAVLLGGGAELCNAIDLVIGQ